MQTKQKAFTLVEMIVAMAVSTIIIAATYASYEMVSTQYKKNLDIAEMHQSGRAIMQMIERDIRMAGFKYIDKDAKVTYGSITGPLVIKDSGDKCCDEVTVIYDHVEDVLDWKGRLVSSSVNRIRIHYWTEVYTSKKGDRYRLYKQKDILGKGNLMLANPIIGNKEVMADFIEDLQFINITTSGILYAGNSSSDIWVIDPATKKKVDEISLRGHRADGGLVFGPNGFLYAGNSSSDIWVIDPVTKKKVDEISLRGNRADGGLVFGPNGFLYAGNSSSEIWVIDPVTKNKVNEISLRGNRADGGLVFGSNGFLYAGNSSSDIWVIDPATRKKVDEISLRGNRADGGLVIKTKSTGQESLVTINLTLRAKNEYGKNRQFIKKDYHGGNFKLDKTDRYKRDTFSSSVLVRNLML